ncbi:MAG TPA: MlaD family protein [Ramlibacter sp.]|uniref:MlaD family protein n=1 Tax=Ramlibacter sp. TaxID=1917967 RepID=UPI002C627AB3|nr:MlaD family protein [Ramlibacter sp.]HVZ43869.1 MlaD family protein [Ramlibacter sp.]
MENKAHALAAGIFVAALTLFLLLLAAWLTRESGPSDSYFITTRLTVTGLQPQAPVRFRGVDVGKVSHIGFDPARPGNVLLKLSVGNDTPMTRDTFATLSYQGVTGLAFIQLSDHGKPAAVLPPDSEIPLEPGLIAQLEDRGQEIMDRVNEVAGRVNRVLNDENQKRFASALARLDDAAGSAKQLASRLDETASKHLDPALDQATVTLRSITRTSEEVGRTVNDFDQTAKRLNARDGPMDKLAEGTQALAHAADNVNMATLPRLNRVTEEASHALRQFGRTVGNLQDNPQSLIFGGGRVQPGPGEPGFAAPGGAQ